MSDLPLINFFKIMEISDDYIHLEWNVSNCHNTEIIGVGKFGFLNNVKIPRNKNQKYEYELVATNIESNLEANQKLEVFPAPIVNNLKLISKGNFDFIIESDFTYTKLITIEEIPISYDKPTVFNVKKILSDEITLRIEGLNENEIIYKKLKLPKNNGLLYLLLSLLFILTPLVIILFFNFSKARTSNENKVIVCNPGIDTVEFIKTKIKYLINNASKISENSFKDELNCISQLKKNSKILITEKTKDGDNYHEFENMFKTLQSGKYTVENISIEFINGVDRFSVICNQQEDSGTEKYNFPFAFQGQLKGKTRRLKIVSQNKVNDKIEFIYSVFGSYNEQSKKGTVDLKNMTFTMETIGTGKIIINKENTTLRVDSDNSELVSIKN